MGQISKDWSTCSTSKSNEGDSVKEEQNKAALKESQEFKKTAEKRKKSETEGNDLKAKFSTLLVYCFFVSSNTSEFCFLHKFFVDVFLCIVTLEKFKSIVNYNGFSKHINEKKLEETKIKKERKQLFDFNIITQMRIYLKAPLRKNQSQLKINCLKILKC